MARVAIAYMNTRTGLCGIEDASYFKMNLGSINACDWPMSRKIGAATDLIAGCKGEFSTDGMAYWVVILP